MSSPKFSRHRLFYVFSALLGVLSLFTLFGERGALHLWRLWDEKGRLEERNFVLHKENESLRERIGRIRHDDAYLEKIAREELGLVRPGEIIYRFGGSESKKKRAGAFSVPAVQPPPSSVRKPPR
jgi:cell division protein FtsB